MAGTSRRSIGIALLAALNFAAAAIVLAWIGGPSSGAIIVAGAALASAAGAGFAVYQAYHVRDSANVEYVRLNELVRGIERRSWNYLMRQEGADLTRTPTVASLIPALEQRGVWTAEDVAKFRQILRLRNFGAHGEFDRLSMRDLRAAAADAKVLHDKIETGRPPDQVLVQALRRNLNEGLLVLTTVGVVAALAVLWVKAPELYTPREDTAVAITRAGILAAGGGLTALAGVILSLAESRRASAQDLDEYLTDRYTQAIALLGSNTSDLRLGGIFALERLAVGSPTDHETIVEVLSAFVREHSTSGRTSVDTEHFSRPAELAIDVQAALTVLGRLPSRAGVTRAALDRAYLTGAPLRGANLADARLSEADLTAADLSRANLAGALLVRADLAGARLSEANLTTSNLSGANLSGANLSGANLAGALLAGADLTTANLSGANLTTARDLLPDQIATAIIAPSTMLPAGLERA
jgi:uncharacterized protein YjbI with pentapeptide repeats